jgi:hypothetical protein
MTLREALLLLLDHVDYTKGACILTEMVGAVLPLSVLDLIHQVLKDTAINGVDDEC